MAGDLRGRVPDRTYWLWRLRGRRRARLHLSGDRPSVEGLLAGCHGGQYVVLHPKLLTPEGTKLVEGLLEVPRERVLFIQNLGGHR
jgi:hypothetical protein